MSAGPHRVGEVMTTHVHTLSPTMEIMHAVHLLVTKDLSGAPVVDEQQRLLGILTERDCIAVALQASYFDERGGQVRRYMSSTVETVTPDTSLIEVAERFSKASIRRFPVVEEDRLVGMIARRDILRALVGGA